MLAQSLRAGKYRPKPIPKPRPPETPQERYKRKLKYAKDSFRDELDKQYRKDRSYDFLDIYINSSDFDEIFDSYQYGQYKYDPMKYKLKESGWFYDFLKWLVSEGFKLEGIRTNYSSSWDDDDTYSFRIHW